MFHKNMSERRLKKGCVICIEAFVIQRDDKRPKA